MQKGPKEVYTTYYSCRGCEFMCRDSTWRDCIMVCNHPAIVEKHQHPGNRQLDDNAVSLTPEWCPCLDTHTPPPSEEDIKRQKAEYQEISNMRSLIIQDSYLRNLHARNIAIQLIDINERMQRIMNPSKAKD